MYHIIFPETPGGDIVLKLRKTGSTVIAVVLLCMSIPFLLSGILCAIAGESMAGGMFFIGLGLFLLCGALLLLMNRQYPEQLIFDNARAQLRIIEQKGAESTIPYGEISNFHVGIARQENVYFTVEMEKKDGAVWTLAIFADRAKAEEVVSKLMHYVPLQSAPSGTPVSGSGTLDGINCFEKNGISVIEWKPRVSFSFQIVGYAAIFAFVLILFSITGWMRKFTIGYYVALFVGLALTLYTVFYLVYSIRRVYVIEIGRGVVRYYTRGLFGRGLSFDLPIDRIDAVLFNFSIQRAESVIYFLSEEQRKRLGAIMRGDVGNILDSISFMMHLPRIDARGFTVTEKLVLEGIIQRTMSEHGARANL